MFLKTIVHVITVAFNTIVYYHFAVCVSSYKGGLNRFCCCFLLFSSLILKFVTLTILVCFLVLKTLVFLHYLFFYFIISPLCPNAGHRPSPSSSIGTGLMLHRPLKRSQNQPAIADEVCRVSVLSCPTSTLRVIWTHNSFTMRQM